MSQDVATDARGNEEQPTPKTSRKATASMILGSFSLILPAGVLAVEPDRVLVPWEFFFFILPAAVLAVVFGRLARGEIRRSEGRLNGSWRALSGVVFGYCGVMLLSFTTFFRGTNIAVWSGIVAREASAVGSLRTINIALVTYASNYPSTPGAGPNCGYPPSLANLKPGSPASATAAGLLDAVLGAPKPIIKSNFEITYTVGGVDANGCGTTYTLTAVPRKLSATGQRAFFTDQTGVIHFHVIRFSTTRASPTVNDPVQLSSILGPDHPDAATSLNNLADLYRGQREYAQAEPLYQRSLSIREKALGPNHPDVASTLNSLAELYIAQGKYAAAEPLLKRALAIWEKALGPDHPNLAISLEISLKDYAELLMKTDRAAEAAKLVAHANAIRAKYPEKNPPK